MVGTSDDHSTDNSDPDAGAKALLRDWYVYILDKLTHDKDQAENLVRRFLGEGEYDRFTGWRRYKLAEIIATPGGGRVPSPFKGEFWRSDREQGIECKINCLGSSARWTGPASEEVWQAHGRKIAEYQINVIWIYNAAMKDFLQGVGFSSEQVQFDEAQQELPLPEPIHNSPTIAESSEQSSTAEGVAVVMPSTVSRLQKMQLRSRQQKTTAKWAREKYPPDGDIPDVLTSSDMATDIQHWCKRRKTKFPWNSYESLVRFCGRFLLKYRKII